MKLKLIATGLLASVFFTASAADGVNYGKVNFVIAELAGTLFQSGDVVKKLTLQFDPTESDLNAARLSLSSNAEVATPWSSINSMLALKLKMQGQESTGVQTPVNYQGQLSVQTDVVGLINHLVGKFYNGRIQNCDQVSDMSREFCQELKVLEQSRNLGQMRDSMGQLIELANQGKGDEQGNRLFAGMVLRPGLSEGAFVVESAPALIPTPKFTWSFELTGLTVTADGQAPFDSQKVYFARTFLATQLQSLSNSDAASIEQVKAVLTFVKGLIQSLLK